MKPKPPKMTAQQKLEQNQGSRFIFVGTPQNNFAFPKRKYDQQGRRVK